MSTDRTDTDRLNWLVDNGYILELRRILTGGWRFMSDTGVHEDASNDWRVVLDQAMDAAEGQ